VDKSLKQVNYFTTSEKTRHCFAFGILHTIRDESQKWDKALPSSGSSRVFRNICVLFCATKTPSIKHKARPNVYKIFIVSELICLSSPSIQTRNTVVL